MALQKAVAIDKFGVTANYWRIDAICADRSSKRTQLTLSGYLDADIAARAKTDSSIRPLEVRNLWLDSAADPFAEEGATSISFSYLEIKKLAEWSDAQDV